MKSTTLNRWANEVLENNNFSRSITVKDDVQPVTQVMPYINVIRSAGSTTTLYVTPTDNDFYLTNISMSVWGDTTGPTQGNAVITIVTNDDQQNRTFQIGTELSGGTGGQSSINIPFAMRGCLLKKGSNISVSITQGYIMIQGYTGSNRSGL